MQKHPSPPYSVFVDAWFEHSARLFFDWCFALLCPRLGLEPIFPWFYPLFVSLVPIFDQSCASVAPRLRAARFQRRLAGWGVLWLGAAAWIRQGSEACGVS